MSDTVAPGTPLATAPPAPHGPGEGAAAALAADAPPAPHPIGYAVDPARAAALTARAVHTPGGPVRTTHTPLTGAPLADLPLATTTDVDAAYERARVAQQRWARTSWDERKQIMLRLHDLVLDRQAQVMDMVQLESGKVRLNAFEEAGEVAMTARFYGRAARGLLRPRRRAGLYPGLSHAVEHRVPKGVVGIVSPWNYPFNLSISDALAAIMAGNAVVCRPDLQASLSALTGAELLAEAGLPEDVFVVVLGDAPVGKAVLDRADHACFTGSSHTGRRVAVAVAPRLVSYSLELGGKNGAYVADDADLDRAVRGVVATCFSSSGQLCMSAERLVLHERIADEFTRRFVAAVESLRIGTALEFGYDIGSLVGPAQLRAVRRHVEDARAQGATVLTGGRHRPDLGPYVYEPTVLAGVSAEMLCRDEETFGPVVAIYRVPDDEAAIELLNDTDLGLHGTVFSGDLRRARSLATRIHTGTVSINDSYAVAWGSMGVPMGGMKGSGVGRRHGAEGILRFTEAQSIITQRLVPYGPTLGLSDRGYATVLTGALRALKAMGKA